MLSDTAVCASHDPAELMTSRDRDALGSGSAFCAGCSKEREHDAVC